MDDYLELSFKCKKCGYECKTEPLETPPVNETRDYYHVCKNCGEKQQIHFRDMLQTAECDIIELPDSNLIGSKGVFIEYYLNYDIAWLQTLYGKEEWNEVLNQIDTLSSKTRQFIYKLLYVNCFSTLDAYIKQKLYHVLSKDEEAKTKFIESKQKRCPKNQRKQDSIFLLSEFLDKNSFQNTRIIGHFLNNYFNLRIEENERLIQGYRKRNQIVHRNSIDIGGHPIIVTREELVSIMDEVLCYINEVDTKLSNYFTNRLINKL